jgi:hypothetical protein
LVAVLLLIGLTARADDKNEAAAIDAAKAWLALTDAGKFAASWDEAASLFKAAVTKADWEKQIAAVRGPLGALGERTIAVAKFARSLPGAPDGEYVMIQFKTRFEHKAAAVETITPMKDKDGRWRVSGYYIK